ADMNAVSTRRAFVRLLAGAPLVLVAAGRAVAGTPRIDRLIGEARNLPRIADRLSLVSGGLLGTRYRAGTLIGGPRRREEFVVRDDAFDCVTYCEVVLAAALARERADFETWLRRIRYQHGEVRWSERNHYFSEWCRRAIENGICRPVALSGAR